MNTIAISAKAAFTQPRTGLEEYAYQLISHLISEARARHQEKRLLLYAPTWAGIPQEFLQLPLKVIKAPYGWTQVRLALQLVWDNPDVFFNPEQLLPYAAPKNSVITVHDLAYEFYPQYYPKWRRRYLQFVTRHAVTHARKIIAVSERTKRDISKLYGVAQQKIEVIHHGAPLIAPPPATDEPLETIHHFSRLLKTPYFLSVSRIEHKKNIIGLIEAFECFLDETGKNVNLLLVGPPGFGFEQIVWRAKHSRYNARIKLLGYLPAPQKVMLYKRACALVFVSFYEGFGLPVLEAQTLGVPVITSYTSCFPEIVAKSGLLVDPERPRDIARAMEYLIAHKKSASYLIKQGYANAARFSWARSAKKTLNVLLAR